MGDFFENIACRQLVISGYFTPTINWRHIDGLLSIFADNCTFTAQVFSKRGFQQNSALLKTVN